MKNSTQPSPKNSSPTPSSASDPLWHTLPEVNCRGLTSVIIAQEKYTVPDTPISAEGTLHTLISREKRGYMLQVTRYGYTPRSTIFVSLPHPDAHVEQRRADILVRVQSVCFPMLEFQRIPGAQRQDILNDITDILLTDSFFILR